MLSWLRLLRRRAYSAARQREHEARSDVMARHWRSVALSVARQTGRHVGLERSGSARLTAKAAKRLAGRSPRPAIQTLEQ
jgi:hypothetical protein